MADRLEDIILKDIILEHIVELATTVAFEIEGNTEEAEAFELSDKCGQVRIEDETGDLRRRDFDAGGVAIRSDPQVLPAEFTQVQFRSAHPLEFFDCDALAVGKPRTEAGLGGFIPPRKI